MKTFHFRGVWYNRDNKILPSTGSGNKDIMKIWYNRGKIKSRGKIKR